MPNTLLVNDLITREAVRQLKPLMPFCRRLRRPQEDMFSKPGLLSGESVRIRKPARFIGGDGDDITGSIENMKQEQVTLTLEPLVTVGFQFSSREFTLSLDQFSRNWIAPAVTRIAAKIEARAMQYACRGTANSVGTPGSVPTSADTYLEARQVILEHGAGDDDLDLHVTPRMHRAIVNNENSLQVPGYRGGELDRAYLKGRKFDAYGFQWYETTAHYTHTSGDYDGSGSSTPLVNGAGQSGSSLITDGWNSGASDLNEGDVFTIADVFAVDPQTRSSTGRLQEFVVTQDISDTTGDMTISISPAIKGPGDQHQNVDALPADDAAIVMHGATTGDPDALASTTSPNGLAYHPDAYVAAFVPLEVPKDVEVGQMTTDPDTGISVRFTRQWDIKTSQHVNRFDVLWGFQEVYPEIGCRIWS